MADLWVRREDYEGQPLTAAEIGADPLEAIEAWVKDAWDRGEPQANAMCVATVSGSGRPSARTVLLKGVDHGLVFFTNYTSAKATDLAETGVAAANFTWLNIHRQVRASGSVAKISPEASDEYFASRPRGSQIAATASNQSSPLSDRAELESAFESIAEAHPDTVPRPAHWGGYRLVPDRIEFWQGRRSRMHDRIEFSRAEDGWSTQRLAP
ncbi:MAG: pyridoxamine 5'-phosphate oxidase [Acidimicrobiia bacterium]|nr:pyridoxamine 5'-phosphate oxidase [Acidimicrobiia bacterium]